MILTETHSETTASVSVSDDSVLTLRPETVRALTEMRQWLAWQLLVWLTGARW